MLLSAIALRKVHQSIELCWINCLFYLAGLLWLAYMLSGDHTVHISPLYHLFKVSSMIWKPYRDIERYIRSLIC